MKKSSFVNRLTEKTDLPGENLPAQPLVELCGDSRVLIENHRGVTQYGTEQICVRVRYGSVCICGSALRLCRMSGCQLVITGRIDSIQLLRG